MDNKTITQMLATSGENDYERALDLLANINYYLLFTDYNAKRISKKINDYFKSIKD